MNVRSTHTEAVMIAHALELVRMEYNRCAAIAKMEGLTRLAEHYERQASYVAALLTLLEDMGV